MASMIGSSSAVASSSRQLVQPMATQVRYSHIGLLPVQVPPSTTLKWQAYPPQENPRRKLPDTLRKSCSVLVEGPLGKELIALYPCIKFLPTDPFVRRRPLYAHTNPNALPTLKRMYEGEAYEAPKDIVEWSVEPIGLETAGVKQNYIRGLWGLSRSMLHAAVVGVTEGHSEIVHLVGVGYRASIEPLGEDVRDHLDQVFRPVPSQQTPQSYWTSEEQRLRHEEIYMSRLKATEASGRQLLMLRLGYSHPCLMPVPVGLTVSCPQPTKIVIKGINVQQVGQFAASLRILRPPEPYKVS